jgi:NAD(P)-dependent dehydrogenase (short-subunit alcohol dehydrogenase family)
MAVTMAGILDGKVAIVTGAGRGLGRAMTLGLLDAGARVAAVELDAMRWDNSLPPAEAVKNAGAPAAWQQLGRQAIMPERMR